MGTCHARAPATVARATLARATALARTTLVVTVLFSPLVVPHATAQMPEPARAAWNAVVEDWRASVRDGGVVGASIALVRDGRTVDLQTEGMASLAEGRAVDEATIYHWASITKTFTAVAILQLRDRDLLSLDDPIVDYVPELRDVHNPFGPMREITIRHLLSHSAGFRAGTWPWGGDQDWHPHEPTEWSQLVAMMPYTDIRFEPGSRYSYSNPGIIFLGRVIEKVTGDVYEAYIEKNVFRPLDMRGAYFDATPWHLLEHRSDNYVVRGGRPEAEGLDFNTGITVSNGGLNAPVGDLVRWLAFLMGSPVGSDHEGVLRRSSLEEMWEEVVPIGDSPLGPSAMGLSFFLHHPGGRRVIGHTGTQKAFRSFFYLDPDSKVGVVAAFNTAAGDETGPDVEALRDLFTRRVVEEVFPHFHH